MNNSGGISQQLLHWLNQAHELEASDLHISGGETPMFRIHGSLQHVADQSPIADAQLRGILQPICPPGNWERLEREKNTDFSSEVDLGSMQRRYRINLFFSRGQIGACFRIIPEEIPDFQWAGFPTHVADRLTEFRNGLVLMSGVAGSGKTTSLAMIINRINQQGGKRIITVEEPVEYIFPQAPNSMVTQREVGVDVDTFADGLKYGLRQDPDVILVGEIRDRETAQMALSAAETGHLVFSTLHTRDAKGAVSRYADLFPQTVQNEIRSQLSMSLRAVISQHLVPSNDPLHRRELALEIMFNNGAVASAIRFGKIESIDNNILTGRSDGMITLNESIKRLVQDGRIQKEVGLRFVTDPAILR